MKNSQFKVHFPEREWVSLFDTLKHKHLVFERLKEIYDKRKWGPSTLSSGCCYVHNDGQNKHTILEPHVEEVKCLILTWASLNDIWKCIWASNKFLDVKLLWKIIPIFIFLFKVNSYFKFGILICLLFSICSPHYSIV